MLNVTETLGQAIRGARRALGKTLRSTAAEAKISAALLSLVERDKHTPSREVIVAIAKKLGGDPDHWCGLAGKITPDAEGVLANLAKEKPEFFRFLRTLIEQHGGHR